MAILTDAVHDLGDTFAIGLALFFQHYANKGRDDKFSYGYGRFSVFSAFLNTSILVIGSVIMLIESLPRLWNPEPVHVHGMLALAVLGLLVNGAAVFQLTRHEGDLNQKAVAMHLLEDALGWVAVLLGSLVMLFWELPWLDPVLSLAIAGFILYRAVGNYRKIFSIFLQAIPKNINTDKIEKQLCEIPGVKDLHDLHLWTVDGNYHVLSLHLVLNGKPNAPEIMAIKQKAREALEYEHIVHYTIEVEFEHEKCAFE
jgi:cobalt-zinc-cadmium efflux system protein